MRSYGLLRIRKLVRLNICHEDRREAINVYFFCRKEVVGWKTIHYTQDRLKGFEFFQVWEVKIV